ncbi:MAG: heavy-metal-associated domain-containing protein [Tumebacillaceae bacterium]
MTIAHIMIRKAAPVEVRKVQKSLNALTGVDQAVVDLSTNAITVDYETDLVSLNQLRKTVQAAGIDVLSEWKEPWA